jgi:hypothetical protein
MLKLFSALVCILCTQFVHAKILIITHAHNRPEFIEWQYLCFKKFLLDDYEFVVFNDAVVPKHFRAIKEMCSKLQIKCFPIPQEIHSHLYPLILPPERFFAHPSNRHADGIQYSFQQLGFDYDGIVALVDSDLFFIRPISIVNLLEDCDIAAVTSPGFKYEWQINKLYRRDPIKYLWPGVVFMHMNRLPNKQDLDFTPGDYGSFTLDTGGHTYFYLKNNPTVRLKELDEFHFQMNKDYLQISMDLPEDEKIEKLRFLNFNTKEMKFLLNRPHGVDVEFGFNNHFLHYRGASFEMTSIMNHSQEYVDTKTLWIRGFIEDLLKEDVTTNAP